jgi:hypothetical protein
VHTGADIGDGHDRKRRGGWYGSQETHHQTAEEVHYFSVDCGRRDAQFGEKFRVRQISVYKVIACMAAAAIGLEGQTEADPVIEQARQAAIAFTRSLPDYVVKRKTTRLQGIRQTAFTPGEAAGKWREVDVVTADVVAENGTDVLMNIQLNGKPAKDVEKSGAWSDGEFSSTLKAIFSRESAAVFTKQHAVTLLNRPAYRYDYAIDQPHSSWYLSSGGEPYAPAYGGQIWIDQESLRVLRIEMSARDVPAYLELDSVSSAIEYAFVKIGGTDYLLPSHAESMECQRGTTVCFKNATDFRGYRKYSADTNITFGDK